MTKTGKIGKLKSRQKNRTKDYSALITSEGLIFQTSDDETIIVKS